MITLSVCFRAIAAFAIAALLSAPAQAQQAGFIDEARFGIAWINPEFIEKDHPELDQFGLNAEVLFTPFDFDFRADPTDGFVRELLTPRFHLGTTVNLDEDGTSTFYGGLTWHHALGERFFVETSLGLSANNGEIDGKYEGLETYVAPSGRLRTRPKLSRARLGSNVTFRESLSIGYNVTESMNVMLSIAHNSHSRIFDDKNRGLTNIALKTGFKF